MSDVLRFDLAKDPKGNPITYGRVGDSNGLTRRVKVFEDGKPLDLTDWATTFEGNTSNWKTKVFDTEGISIIDAVKGEFRYTFPNMAFAVEGQYERAYFSFIKGDQRKSTGNFEIIVLGNSDIDAPEAETVITEYNKLVAELQELQKSNIANLQEQQDTYIQSTDKT
ncbi:BppU family phage baseplate upper protein, partial [Enterococcus malodoratus]|uniref:BppU family phage baseplate upper protein n=1 Tax=Enterococcus malodoratus TaxID=71451 RepID=UPI002074319F